MTHAATLPKSLFLIFVAASWAIPSGVCAQAVVLANSQRGLCVKAADERNPKATAARRAIALTGSMDGWVPLVVSEHSGHGHVRAVGKAGEYRFFTVWPRESSAVAIKEASTDAAADARGFTTAACVTWKSSNKYSLEPGGFDKTD